MEDFDIAGFAGFAGFVDIAAPDSDSVDMCSGCIHRNYYIVSDPVRSFLSLPIPYYFITNDILCQYPSKNR